MVERVNVLIAQNSAGPWTTPVHGALASLPVDLLAAQTDNEAVDVLARNAMHAAIFCDNLPGGGIHAVRRVRSLGLHVPCLLVTPDPSDRILREALELDVFSVINADKSCDLLLAAFIKMITRAYHLTGPAWSRSA